MQNKKDAAIIFVANQAYQFALASMLINLQEKCADCYDDIVVYQSGFSDLECEALKKIEENIIFVNYSFEDWKQEHHQIDLASRSLQSFIKRFTHLALSKYKIFEQLENYHRILFLDLDMLIQENISELFDIEGIAWRTESEFHRKFGDREDKSLLDGLDDIPEKYPAPNGGLFYASDIIDWRACLASAKQFLICYAESFSSVIDELTFSWVAYKNDLTLTELDYRLYNVLPRVVDTKTKIIHFMGKHKTWNDELMQFAFPDWLRNYKKSQRITHLNTSMVTDFAPQGQIYRQQYNQLRWLTFLNETELEIPGQLKLRYDFNTEKLILDYKSNIYYAFSLNKNNTYYAVELCIENINLVTDIVVQKTIEQLLARNEECFTIRKSAVSLSIFSKWQDINKIATFFDYFFKVTQPLLTVI